MKSFKPRPTTPLRQFSRLLNLGCLICLCYFLDLFFKTNFLRQSSVIVIVIFTALHTMSTIVTRRLFELVIDTERKEVVIYTKLLFSKVKKRKIPFEQVILEIDAVKPFFSKHKEIKKLVFLRKQIEVFYITQSKDNVESTVFNEIHSFYQQLELPSKNI